MLETKKQTIGQFALWALDFGPLLAPFFKFVVLGFCVI